MSKSRRSEEERSNRKDAKAAEEEWILNFELWMEELASICRIDSTAFKIQNQHRRTRFQIFSSLLTAATNVGLWMVAESQTMESSVLK